MFGFGDRHSAVELHSRKPLFLQELPLLHCPPRPLISPRVPAHPAGARRRRVRHPTKPARISDPGGLQFEDPLERRCIIELTLLDEPGSVMPAKGSRHLVLRDLPARPDGARS